MDAKRATRAYGAVLCTGFALYGTGCGDDGSAPTDAGIDSEVVGTLTNQGSTEMEEVRVQEGGIPNFIVDSLRAEGERFAGQPIDIALIQGGAIRGGRNLGPPDFQWSSETARIGNLYGPGPITKVDVQGWYPFDNGMFLMTLTGAQIKRSLEQGISTWADDAGTTFGPDLMADVAGPFLHVSGMTYTATCPGTTRMKVGPTNCDPYAGTCMYTNAEQANTVSRMTIGGAVIYDVAAGGWQSGGDTRTFRVITSDFLASGLDNHIDFPDGTDRMALPTDQFILRDVLVARMRALSPVTLAVENRIQVVGTVHGLACNLPATCTAAHRPTHPNCAHLR